MFSHCIHLPHLARIIYHVLTCFLCTLTHVVLCHVRLIILIISNTIKSKNNDMGGSIVDNLHGCITCGQCPRVDHVWKISMGGPHVDSWSRVEHMWTEGISPEIY